MIQADYYVENLPSSINKKEASRVKKRDSQYGKLQSLQNVNGRTFVVF